MLAGGCAIDAYGQCLPQETLDACLASDSVLLGAVGGPKWDHVPGPQRPEKALLGLRSKLGLYLSLIHILASTLGTTGDSKKALSWENLIG